MPKYIKRLFAYCLILSYILCLCGCSGSRNDVPRQFEPGDNEVVIKINIRDFGTAAFRLFPDEAPLAFEAFEKLCKDGYYDGKQFFFELKDYLLMAGENEGERTGEADIKKNQKLYPFYGALCVSCTSEKQADFSKFYVISMDKEKLSEIEELVEHKGYTLTDYIRFGYETELTGDELELFRTYGGSPWLYGHTLVLGQITEGMDVLLSVAGALEEDPGAEIFIDYIEFV